MGDKMIEGKASTKHELKKKRHHTGNQTFVLLTPDKKKYEKKLRKETKLLYSY